MFKKVFTFTDYEGKEKTLEAYFNLSKNDCIDLNRAFEDRGGLINYLTTLIKESKEAPNEPPKEDFVRFVRLLVSKAYGIRPKDDPSLFLKEDDNGVPYARKFRGTPAYDNYVFDLLTGKESLDEFTNSIMPEIDEEQRAEAEKYLEEQGVNLKELQPPKELPSEAPVLQEV